MAARYEYVILFSVCFVLALSENSGLQPVNGRIKITVGTSAGYSSVQSFIQNQLIPAADAYGRFLDIEFVPWGKTRWDDTTNVIECIFGATECWANRLHRCVLDKLKSNQTAQLQYMACEFSPPYPSYVQGTYVCAQTVGLNVIDVDYCVANPGDNLDTAAYEAAAEPIQKIDFIPYIVFNDNTNLELHENGLNRLPNLICFALSEDPSTGVTGCYI